ncbi:MAG: hypothetical protein ACOCP7_01220 [Desulfohalobiaceae bacterium]
MSLVKKGLGTSTAVLINQNIWDKEHELQTLANKLTASGGFTPEQIKIKLKARRQSASKELLETMQHGGYNSIMLSADREKSPRWLFGENVYETLLDKLKETEIVIVA